MRISNYFELDNEVMTTPKNCSVLSFTFTCLCICNPLLTDDDDNNNNNNNNNNNKGNNFFIKENDIIRNSQVKSRKKNF